MEQLPKRRIRLQTAYDGTNYSGWQKQNNAPTIQEEIEKRLQLITQENISLHGAGRTDAGVHAEAMTAHFDTGSTISVSRLQTGLNALLPGAIRILNAEETDHNFHARFSAVGKCYRYHLYTGAVQPPQIRFYSLHIHKRLNHTAIKESLGTLLGEHDFSSFENSGTRDKTVTTGRGAVRKIYRAELQSVNTEQLFIEFVGDGFLKNMVRNLVGTLLDVGREKITPKDFASILAAQDRNAAGATAPAHGLFLHKVFY